ncbi:MAG: recombinase family protein [Lachnospira sp.]|nr:recombinase family protein [Lachnospira sp.]
MTNYNGKEVLNGLLFIQSMMSVENVERQAIALRKLANKAGVDCNHALLDDSYSKSIDRDAICDLLEYLDTGRYQVLVVEDVYDLTTNIPDLKAMIDRINSMGVIIFDLATMTARYNNYAKEC